MGFDNETKQLVCIYVIVVSLIFVYWTFLKFNSENWDITKGDVLNETVIKSPFGNFSWWPLSHFIMNAILGFLYPNKGVFILGAGVLWELVEVIMGIIAKKLNADQEKKKGGSRIRTGDRQYENQWWAGSFQDIAFNTAGFFTGKLLRQACMC